MIVAGQDGRGGLSHNRGDPNARTIDILNRCAGVPNGPKFGKADAGEILVAIRKVYPAVAGAGRPSA